MGIKLNTEFAMGQIVGIEDIQKETSALLRATNISASNAYEEIQERQQAEMQTLMADAYAHQIKCANDAEKFLEFYWGGDDKHHSIEIAKMHEWLDKNQPLDRWFFIHLIEVAGQKALDLGYSQHKAEIARSKNAAPRAWVLTAWMDRKDEGQSKAAFSRQYAILVKQVFKLAVTADTIARDWLPKNKK